MPDETPVREVDKQTISPEAHSPNAQLRDKRVTPEGVVPKQAQGYVIAGLAVLILMAVMFSKNHAKPAAKELPAPPLAVSTDMNQRKIQELEQDLSADQRQSQQQQQAWSSNSYASTTNGTTTNASPTQASGIAAPAPQLPPASETPRDPIADAEKAMAFKARFASNLVSATDAAAHPPAEAAGSAEINTAPSARPLDSQTQVAASQAATKKRATEVNVNSAHGQPYALFEGTTIDTALVNR